MIITIKRGYCMRIGINGIIETTRNCKGPWINYIEIIMKDGKEIIIDREYSYYDVDKENFNTTWYSCYIWNGSEELAPKINLTDIKKVKVIIEDDVDEDYFCEAENVTFSTLSNTRTFCGNELLTA